MEKIEVVKFKLELGTQTIDLIEVKRRIEEKYDNKVSVHYMDSMSHNDGVYFTAAFKVKSKTAFNVTEEEF